MSSEDVDFVLSQFTKRSFKKDDILFESNDSDKQTLYILNTGKVKVERDGRSFTLSSGSYFGDSSFIKDSEGEKIVFLEESTCGTVPISTIKSFLKTSAKPKKVKVARFSSIPEPDVNVSIVTWFCSLFLFTIPN